ncbi:hypothetical protein AVEN_63821-1 [Araneus ventricosus]|uniref:Uncharacterized protein n=1 Tax=Araneus ventricosus TaxID=182803 RepID=A0A4Y2ULI1_ARAVE|nr:hypothetical protein AVEN_63821-1 [Araneus ventricosus]
MDSEKPPLETQVGWRHHVVSGILTSSGEVTGAPTGVKHLPVFRWILVILTWVNGYLQVANRHPQVGYARVTSSKALTRNQKVVSKVL